MYSALPVPPGTSLSWMPHSSLYCCHASVSRISAADRNRRIASSPFVSPPRRPSARLGNTPTATVPAPAASPVCKNERRLIVPDCKPISSRPSCIISNLIHNFVFLSLK